MSTRVAAEQLWRAVGSSSSSSASAWRRGCSLHTAASPLRHEQPLYSHSHRGAREGAAVGGGGAQPGPRQAQHRPAPTAFDGRRSGGHQQQQQPRRQWEAPRQQQRTVSQPVAAAAAASRAPRLRTAGSNSTGSTGEGVVANALIHHEEEPGASHGDDDADIPDSHDGKAHLPNRRITSTKDRDKQRFRSSRHLEDDEGVNGRTPSRVPPGAGGAAKTRQARATVAAAVSAISKPTLAPRSKPKQEAVKAAKKKTDVFLPSYVTVSNLARLLGVKLWNLQVCMRNLGHTDLRPDLTLAFSDAELIAAEFDLVAIANDEAAFDIYPRPSLATLAAAQQDAAKLAALPVRPPIVTIMGHVDHGKTTLLDKLRSTSVAAGEAGGITQHIGAFSVAVQSSSSSGDGPQFVTFLDTPGHAAFTAMRSRGASVTDIIVLVVAADDGVMPQTREVIALWKDLSAREAQFDASVADPSSSTSPSSNESGGSGGTGRRLGSGSVQLVVALTKTDKPTADPDRVKRELLSEGIELEEFGGEIPSVEVSGKTGDGLELLQDTLVTLAELAELRAEREGPVEGYVIESKVAKGRGNVATVLVKRGALRVGDVAVAGTTWVKVRSLADSAGQSLRELQPGQAGVVTGWKELPHAGHEILGAPPSDGPGEGGESAAKRAVENRKRRLEAVKLGEDVAQINEQRRRLAEEQDRKKRLEFVERQQRRLAEAALAAGKSVEELIRESKVAARAEALRDEEGGGGGGDGKEGSQGATTAEGTTAGAAGGESGKKELLVIVKADVSGSVEAVIGAISGIGNKQAGVRIVSSGVGEPTEGDLAMARAVGAQIICFNVGIPRPIARAAASYSPPTPLHTSPIIYRLMEHVSTAVAALLPPLRTMRVTGEASVVQVFKIHVRSRVVVRVAGCRVLNGVIRKNSEVRVLRAVSSSSSSSRGQEDEEGEGEGDGAGRGEGDEDATAGLTVGSHAGSGRKVIYVGKLDSLKHGKHEVAERGKGTECGLSFDGGFQGFEEGDVVQCFYTVEEPRSLL